ncbi:Protein psiR [Hondaea fermentalgiana]|uniref:Protein psiR n=1 Tax=Hondaea fermentalgiana TaxID=2315210 RepID=A0A2R5GNL5_9STRA|nr:Protein psiR [Hondaea fermentalgiana]|eukprot:GBG30213.1 Protein psiR [Hondaea fermentalgiana]
MAAARTTTTSPAALLAAAVALMATIVQGNTLTYRLTLRDFLPAHCIPETEYVELYEYLDASSVSRYMGMRDSVATLYPGTAIPDDWYANDLGKAMDLSTDDGPTSWDPKPDFSSIQVNHYCPYWTQGLWNGTIKSHPDFEAAEKSKVSGLTNCTKGGQNFGTCNDLSNLIKSELEIATSGLPKVVYYNSTYNSRCGCHVDGLCTTSRQQYFSSWYNDDPTFNKRVGQKLVLTFNEAKSLYGYASSSFFPLDKFDAARDEGLYTDGPAVYEENYPDPKRAHTWPNSFRDTGRHHFWFTTEFHTYFEYSGNEAFNFTGDDDFWVFINEKLAIDLGGTHGSTKDNITLAEYAGPEYLNLTIGEIYPLSFFHAERHTDASNFNIYTSISESCNVARPGTSSVAFSLLDAIADDQVALSQGRDKAYIEEGKLYNLDRAVEYDPNDEYNVVTRMVMNTSAELQRERARRAAQDGTEDISNLASQNEELQEQIRMAKQRKQLEASRGFRVSRFFSKPKGARKLFSPESL